MTIRAAGRAGLRLLQAAPARGLVGRRPPRREPGRAEPVLLLPGLPDGGGDRRRKGRRTRRPRAMLARLGLSIFFTMNVMAFTMALWTTDVYGTDRARRRAGGRRSHGLFRYLVLLFSLPVLALLGWPLFEHAWAGLRRGVVSTDWLLASGVGAAFAASFLSVFRGEGPVYFEVGCVILVMTTLGRWLEATGKLKASAALDDLARLLPDRVRRIVDGREEIGPGARSAVGDRLRVLPGERFPADGRVVAQRGPGRRAGADGREPAGAQGAGRPDPRRHAQPRRRPDDRGDRGAAARGRSPGWSSWSAGPASRRGAISGWPTGRPACSCRRSRRSPWWPSRSTGPSARWSAGSGRAWRSG